MSKNNPQKYTNMAISQFTFFKSVLYIFSYSAGNNKYFSIFFPGATQRNSSDTNGYWIRIFNLGLHKNLAEIFPKIIRCSKKHKLH